MIKELDLNQVWIECLAMWKWIYEVYDGSVSVVDLKMRYSRKHKVPMCSFCSYNRTYGDTDEILCTKCPGNLVDPTFNCHNDEYNYYDKPKEFYKKLLSMNKKRIKNASSKSNASNIQKA